MRDRNVPLDVNTKEYIRRLEAFRMARTSIERSGFNLSPECERLHHRYICGAITAEEHLSEMHQLYPLP